MEALQFSQIVEPIQFSFEVDLLEFVFDLHEDEMTIKFPYKDPDETQDYELDWTARLDALPTADDTIDSSSWSIVTDMSGHAAPLVIEAIQKSDNETRVWLSGGTTGEKYELLNRVTTTAGRIMDQTCELKIKER